MTPQEKAKLVLKRRNVEGMFGQSPIYAIVDSRLSDQGHRLLTLMAAKRVIDPTITIPREEIAIALNCSDSKAKRCVRELERLGWVKVRRCHNKANSYQLCGAFETAKSPSSTSSTTTTTPKPAIALRSPKYPCSECGRGCRNSNTGWCWRCRLKKELKTELRREQSDRGKITA